MKAVRFLLLILITILFNLGISQAQTVPNNAEQKTIPTRPDANADNEKEAYRIGYQDVIEVRVFRPADLSFRYSINKDGTIDLVRSSKPIKVVCKTEREVATEIEAEYLSFLKKPQVNVFVVEKKSQSYGVIGAVEKPGNYYGTRRVRLLELLAMAGGQNKEAGNRLIVARTGSTSACQEEEPKEAAGGEMVLMSFKIKDVLEVKQNLWMQPGDIVSVLDADEVYVYGNVNKVGSVKMKEPITLTQAIVSAEGLKPTAKSQVRVLRQKPGSADREELIYNLKDIEKRKVQDPFLEPNDIVAVSEDSSKAIMRGITKTLQQGIPSLFYAIPL